MRFLNEAVNGTDDDAEMGLAEHRECKHRESGREKRLAAQDQGVQMN